MSINRDIVYLPDKPVSYLLVLSVRLRKSSEKEEDKDEDDISELSVAIVDIAKKQVTDIFHSGIKPPVADPKAITTGFPTLDITLAECITKLITFITERVLRFR